jgi:hypothetical protein
LLGHYTLVRAKLVCVCVRKKLRTKALDDSSNGTLNKFNFFFKQQTKLNYFFFKLVELMYFMLIVLLFMFAFGVSTQSLLYHNQNLDSKLLRNVFFPSYFVIGGEYYTRNSIMNGILFSQFVPYSNY